MRAAAPITWLAIPLLLCSAGIGFAQTVDTTFWAANGRVDAITLSEGTVYIGGAFTSIGGQPRGGIAAFDATSGALTAWNPNANGEVMVLAVNGGTIYVGGTFTSIGGQPRNAIAALDAASGSATGWNPDALYGLSRGAVDALVVNEGTVYVGGEFSSIGGQLRNAIAALDTVSGAATGWNPNAIRSHEDADAVVGALAVNGGIVYAGGWFTVIGGQARNGIAALDAASGAATGWNADARYGVDDGTVDALVVSGGTIYAAGGFTSIGGQPRNSIAALDAASGAATAWDPNPNANGGVMALAVNGGTIYVGGTFTSIGGQPRSRIAALDATSGAATGWNADADDLVRALAVNGGTVYAGGEFTSIGAHNQAHIAVIHPDLPTATLLAQFDAASTADGIELRWSFVDPSRVATVAVERAVDAAGPWESIDPEQHHESGVTVALDHTLEAGAEYFYRLVAQLRDGSRVVFGPISANRGEPLTMSDLTLVSPNPTPGGIHVQYAVARGGQVRLELLDVSGRLVATLADRTQEPGRYEIAWDGAGPRGQVAPGLYFFRLMTPDRVTVRKLAVVR